jgi:uncharacterized protein YndB with AHSA1/START domain
MYETIITKQPDKKQLTVKREFKGPVKTVWKAWTDPDLLDRWWAPKPWKAKTKHMDFRIGGHWLYSMNGPEGEKHWSRADFKEIQPGVSYRGRDAFCDAQGNVNHEMPVMDWDVTFSETVSGTTLVQVVLTFDSLSDLETLVEMGFKEGFAAAHGNLDALLEEVNA